MQTHISEYELRKGFIMYLINHSEIIPVREKESMDLTLYGLSYQGVTIPHIEGTDKDDLINRLENEMGYVVNFKTRHHWLLEGLYSLFIQDVTHYLKKILNPTVYIYSDGQSNETTALLDIQVFKVRNSTNPIKALSSNILNAIIDDPSIVSYFIKERPYYMDSQNTLDMVRHAHNIWYPEHADVVEANWAIYDRISDIQYVLTMQAKDLETIHTNTQQFLTEHLQYMHTLTTNYNIQFEMKPFTIHIKHLAEPFSNNTVMSKRQAISKLLKRPSGGI